jgi:hypothetical protein
MRSFFLTVVSIAFALVSSGCVATSVANKPLVAEFHYPTEARSPFGSDRIDSDLIKEQRAELKAAKKKFKTEKDKAKRGQEVSKLMQERNAEMLVKLDQLAPAHETPGKITSITAEEARSVLEAIRSNPVVSDQGAHTYDSMAGTIGYCFGRATFVHLELLRRGVAPESIAKIFAVGSMRYGGLYWEFHVATMVRAQDGGWWTIDGLSKENLKLADWMKQVQGWDVDPENPRVRFYLADAAKFQPIPGTYNIQRMHAPLYGTYFVDLENWFRNSEQKKFTRSK